jgi:hypothetical protein
MPCEGSTIEISLQIQHDQRLETLTSSSGSESRRSPPRPSRPKWYIRLVLEILPAGWRRRRDSLHQPDILLAGPPTNRLLTRIDSIALNPDDPFVTSSALEKLGRDLGVDFAIDEVL